MSDIDRYEALVKQMLCKCVIGNTWMARNNCPLHPDLTPIHEIVADQRGWTPPAKVSPSPGEDLATL